MMMMMIGSMPPSYQVAIAARFHVFVAVQT
jgi:hypothetical protein